MNSIKEQVPYQFCHFYALQNEEKKTVFLFKNAVSNILYTSNAIIYKNIQEYFVEECSSMQKRFGFFF